MSEQLNWLRKPITWMIAVPAILLLWSVVATSKMNTQRRYAKLRQEEAQNVLQEADLIGRILKRAGQNDAPSLSVLGPFDGAASARQAAQAALITEQKLTRGQRSQPKAQKDGSRLFRESYNLQNVRLIQIAQFIDHAERNFDSVNCNQVTITYPRNRSKDSWDATINFEYIKKP